MTDLRVSQAFTLAGVEYSVDVRVGQAYVLAAVNYPAERMDVSQAYVLASVASEMEVHVSQAYVLAAVRIGAASRKVRAWTYSQDGHDFYVLQLGTDGTLVCDLTTGQWAQWKSANRESWRAIYGLNWTGIGGDALTAASARTNVVAGDEVFGLLWLVDPELPYDEHPTEGDERPFDRIATAGVPMRMRETARCNEAYVLASKGEPGLSLDTPVVALETSDDADKTWQDQGSITVTQDDWSQELVWRSLGLIGAPGRSFRITDNCLARLDGLEIR